MLIETLAQRFLKSWATNSTATSFASKIPTLTKPSGDGVVDLTSGAGVSQNGVRLLPFGAGSDNDTFDMRVILWTSVGNGTSEVWIPYPVGQFTCTLSTTVGVTGGAVVATDRFVDTIITHATIPIGTTGVDWTITSAANQLIASIMLDTKGAQLVEINFDMTGATNGNALVGKW